jgi:hypothetical protein
MPPKMTNGSAIASIALLLLAVSGGWPYGFYTLLRVVVCGSASYLAVHSHAQRKSGWSWLMAGTTVLFNPIVPVHLSRARWQPIDFIAAVVFAISLAVFRV